ncbi:MAG: sugar phosphate isomerase/epimerase [Lentisphaeria bacterium]|nr:sugar phosphate isomerase/epimerase [Lentisphaeria bacterium]
MEVWRASHFFDFTKISDSEWDKIFAEFAENGGEYLTINTALLKRMITDSKAIEYFQKLGEKYNIKFFDIHGLCGKGYDLNTVDSSCREIMFQDHVRAFEIAEILGVRNYVMHIGAWCCVENIWEEQKELLRKLATESLEKLLPEAEKKHLSIAIENAFEPSNSADELLIYLKNIQSPALGACFDAGHALMMSDTMIKRERDENNDVERQRLWHGKLKFDGYTLDKMLPYVITCHLHDNDGYNDNHQLIFSGSANWDEYAEKLRKAPRLSSVQNELKSGANSIQDMCLAFDRLRKMIMR